jgi:hypothetical protein
MVQASGVVGGRVDVAIYAKPLLYNGVGGYEAARPATV